MAQSELAALDRVLHRLASTPDEKLAPVLSKLLPQLHNFTSHFNATRF